MKINIARYIDHTNLKPDATPADIEKLCKEAIEYEFASVCVNPIYVPTAAAFLDSTLVRVCSVVGFPLGASTTYDKASETETAIDNGAAEIDMVIPVGLLKAGQYDRVMDDIAEVVEAADGNLVKVIIEACLLTDDEKKHACELAMEAGADFVKTSTGFSKGGATISDVKLMRSVVGPDMGVKAAGGIRDAQTALAMIEAGASRIGTSSSIAIFKGL